MRILVSFTILLLAALANATPAQPADDKTINKTNDSYPYLFVKYKSEHDIVSILVPINSLNYDEDNSSSSGDLGSIMFFVEADIDADKKRTYKGLYVLKDNKATKILENGIDAAASADNSKQVFFAATDGLYEYKADTKEAVKYGSITDSIIGIAKTNTSEDIYILTEDHELFKVTDAGNTKTKIEGVVNAQEIVLDYQNNLYFYAEDKQPYVLTAEGIKKIEGLPANPTEVRLIKPALIHDVGVPFMSDNVAYLIYPNGTSQDTGFHFKPNYVPTAYAVEAGFLQYYAYDKKIYEYNLLVIVLSHIVADVQSFLKSKRDEIRTLVHIAPRHEPFYYSLKNLQTISQSAN